MNGLIRKTCILKQIRGGFSADGSPLSGVARVEKYGGKVSLQISLINFATLSEGKYVCVLCDRSGEKIVFALTPQSGEYRADNSAFAPESGFCVLICFIRTEVTVLAAGQNGSGTYSMKLLLEGLQREKTPAPPPARIERFSLSDTKDVAPMPEDNSFFDEKISPAEGAESTKYTGKYDDEAVSEVNYYAQGRAGESAAALDEADEGGKGGSEKKKAENGAYGKENDDALRHGEGENLFAFAKGESYYLQVKDELEALFSKGRRTDVLNKALPYSEWVEVAESDGCLIGLIYEDLQVRYIAYALPASDKNANDKTLADACYISCDPLQPQRGGYYVFFQDAANGATIKMGNA